MAVIAGLSFMTQQCTSNDEAFTAALNTTRGRLEHVDRKAEVAGAMAEVAKDIVVSDGDSENEE